MKLSDMLSSQPAELSVPEARSDTRDALIRSKRRLVVIVDDPAGSQTANDAAIHMDWSRETLDRVLSSESPVFFLSTNSRSISSEDAAKLAEELGRNLSEAARKTNVEILVASVGDGALRGHYPQEVDALIHGLGRDFDGVIVVPAFFEGGFYTVDDTHWTELDHQLASIDKTEFARDRVFGFRNGNLKQWIEEKTQGTVRADRVRSISLQTLRNGGPVAVENELLQTSKGQTVIVNAACYADLEVFALGLIAAELQGKSFIYRCGPSFVKARGGFQDRPFLTCDQIHPGDGPGLLVAGSYSDNTSRQLHALIQSKLAVGVELRADALLEEQTIEAEIARASAAVNERLADGDSTALYASRTRHSISASGVTKLGHTIITSLSEISRRIEALPGFLVTKGAVTSMEVARSLELKEAMALGQVISGVPAWRLGSHSRWPDIPFIQFPGEIGGDNALLDIFVRCDSARHSKILHLR